MTAPPDRIARYDIDGNNGLMPSAFGRLVEYRDHTAAIAAAEARGLRMAARVVESHSVRREYQDEILGALSGRNLVKPETIRRAILALIPGTPDEGGDTLASALTALAQNQEPLGADIERAVDPSGGALYEP